MEKTGAGRLAGLIIECGCGQTHKVPIRHILSGSGALAGLPEILAPFARKNALLVGDNNTLPLAGDVILKMLGEAGCKADSRVFNSDTHLILDERLIGAMLLRLPPDTGLIIALGSGTINDLCRVISAKCGIPYIVVCTAPSMDGYASAVSPVVTPEGKGSYPLCVPYAIIADADIMKDAPDVMLSAGVGDILGKYFALNDWRLAERETGERCCPYIARVVMDAVEKCIGGISGVKSREPAAITSMADALVMSGAAIAMAGSSRPASGCEHQLAHHWEVSMIRSGRGDVPLHGNLVGYATQAAAILYSLAREEFSLGFPPLKIPSREEIAAHMSLLGDYSSAEALGVTKDLLYESFFHATHANGRYTLIMHIEKAGRLERYANLVTEALLG